MALLHAEGGKGTEKPHLKDQNRKDMKDRGRKKN